MVFQNGNTVTIGSDCELDRSSSQVGQYSLVVWMHSVLTSAQVHGADRKAFHDGLHLIQGEPIRASWIAVAKGTGEIALVSESEPQRDRGVGLGSHLHANLERSRFPIQLLASTSVLNQ